MDYKRMTDSELASIMVSYITRVEHLKKLIGFYLDSAGQSKVQPIQIKEVYRQLKCELRENANYLNLVRNNMGSKTYTLYFSPSIREASAFGFTVPVNSTVNHAMFSAVSEALYKLIKYHSLEEWGK